MHLLGIIALSMLLSLTPAKASEFKILADKQYSLGDRYENASVNMVFSDNILLTLAYIRGIAKRGEPIPWDQVHEPFIYHLTLQPGQTFAFHEAVLEKYKSSLTQTTNAHFSFDEGFKSDGWLIG